MKSNVEFYKIPDLFLFEPTYKKGRKRRITDQIRPDMQWVFRGEGVPTVKYDGSPCAIINGKFYRQYKKRRSLEDAIPWNENVDPLELHCHWIPVDPEADWRYMAAYNHVINEQGALLEDGTYEAIGAHFCSNPYQLNYDTLVPHGKKIIGRTFSSPEEIRKYLGKHQIEGIVFWKDGKPQCKVTRRDYWIKWPLPKKQGRKKKK